MSWKIDLTIPTPFGDAHLGIENDDYDNYLTDNDIRDHFLDLEDEENED
jgi:hypothetical protein